MNTEFISQFIFHTNWTFNISCQHYPFLGDQISRLYIYINHKHFQFFSAKYLKSNHIDLPFLVLWTKLLLYFIAAECYCDFAKIPYKIINSRNSNNLHYVHNFSKLCKISKTSAEICKIARNAAKWCFGVGSPAWSEADYYQHHTLQSWFLQILQN